MNDLNELYSQCMSCDKRCVEEIRADVPPRGFYFKKAPVDILVVSKNPGHPLADEAKALGNNKGMALVEAYKTFQEGLFTMLNDSKDTKNKKDGRSKIFHKNLYRYIAYILDDRDLDKSKPITGAEIIRLYNRIASTDLFKCSTKNEQQGFNRAMFQTCFETHLLKEIEILDPKVILALGREVEGFLNSRKSCIKSGVKVIYVKHPSYFYKEEDEAAELDEIKKAVQGAINARR